MNGNQKTKRRSREEIERLKTICAASGKSKKEFAAEHGINYMTLMSWFSSKGKKQPVTKKASFIPVQVVPQTSTPFAEIHFPNGRCIIFHQPVSANYFQSFMK